MNLAELAEKSAQRLGERKILMFEDGSEFTNLQFLDYAKRFQRGFSQLGLGKNQSAAMVLVNHPLVYPVFQGIFRTGGTAIPVMFTNTAPELRYVFEDSMARGVITDDSNIEKVREAVQGLKNIEWIVVRGGKDNPDASPREYGLDTFFKESPEENLPNILEDDVALMLYTAGTTGSPKGVMLTHSALFHTAYAANKASDLHRFDTPRISVNVLPMAHIFGVGVMLTGYEIPDHLADSYGVQMAWFEPERYMQLIQEHRANNLAVVPTLLAFLLSHPKIKEYDLTSLEEVISGAAPLPEEVGRAFSKLVGIDHVREIYGCTECCGLGTSNPALEPYRPGSAGKAYEGMQVQIFDEKDNPLPVGEKGEVVIKGPAVMKGYFNRPAETDEVLRNGWLHTGDIGYLDEDGYLYIADRKKDMIIRGGENIYPGEIEKIIYKHPGVAEAAVVGKPDAIYGESVVAYVVPWNRETITEKDLTDFIKTQTSSFKCPSEIYFIDALPKSPVGKILKRKLRELAAGDK